jgi:hypothetical protein
MERIRGDRALRPHRQGVKTARSVEHGLDQRWIDAGIGKITEPGPTERGVQLPANIDFGGLIVRQAAEVEHRQDGRRPGDLSGHGSDPHLLRIAVWPGGSWHSRRHISHQRVPRLNSTRRK